MIVTEKVRQGVKEWPMVVNKPGNELLGRYEFYPKPSGQESQRASGLSSDAPPTDAPQAPAMFLQPGMVGVRLTRKTDCSGADLCSIATKLKNKIRDLSLRF